MLTCFRDNIAFFNVADGSHRTTIPLENTIFTRAQEPLDNGISFADAFYSFGINYPGAITNNNYPNFLQNLKAPDGSIRDLGTVDILRDRAVSRALVFTRTKHRANRLMRHLADKGIQVDAIHSNRSQTQRQRTLTDFHKGRIRVLVATDVVARGIDVEDISHVINYELPNDAQNYVHRVGRTARAGTAGIALSFCDASEVLMLKGIEKLIRQDLPAMEAHAFHSTAVASLRLRPPVSVGPTQWRSFSPRNASRRRFGR